MIKKLPILIALIICTACLSKHPLIVKGEEVNHASLKNFEKRYPNGYYAKYFIGYVFYDNAVWNYSEQKEEADFGFNNSVSSFPSLGLSWSKIYNENTTFGLTLHYLSKDISDFLIEFANISVYPDEVGRGFFLELALGTGFPRQEDMFKYFKEEFFMRLGVGYSLATSNNIESSSILFGANVFFFPTNFHKYEKQVVEVEDIGYGYYMTTYKTVETFPPKDSYILNAQFYVGWGF